MTLLHTFGGDKNMKLMKQKREEANLTQGQLAYIIGVERSTITKIENGGKTSVKTAKRIAEVLGFEWTLFYKTETKAG